MQGEMAEWSIAAVLKTVEVQASGGSNPSLSAIPPINQAFTASWYKKGIFFKVPLLFAPI